MNDQLLRDSLARIGEDARRANLLDGSLVRSRRLGRNRAIGTAAAVVALMVGGGGAAVHWVQPPPDRPAPAASASTPADGSIAGLPGWLYYTDNDRLVRLTRTGAVTVLRAGATTATVSPDGKHLAYVDDKGNLTVTDRDGSTPRVLLRDSAGVGDEPAWTGDSAAVLGARPRTDGPATVGRTTVDTGQFTALPHPVDGLHPQWSADGRHLVYDLGDGRVAVTDADGANQRLIPQLGPSGRGRRSADVFSVSADATLIAIDQISGDAPDGDIGRNGTANAIIDTRTGDEVKLSVSGSMTAAVFQPDGGILVRTKDRDGTVHLTLLAADRSIRVDVVEPAAVRGYQLLAYTQR